MIRKPDFDAKFSSFPTQITANKTKILLIKNELNQSKNFDSIYFIGKSHFEGDDTRNYLVFQPINRYFKVTANTDYVSSCKSKGLSAESIRSPATSNNSLTPVLNYYGTKTRVKFNGSCVQQPKLLYTHGTIVKIHILYELDLTLMIQQKRKFNINRKLFIWPSYFD